MSDDSQELLDVLRDIRRWVKLSGIEEARAKVRDAVSHNNPDKERDNVVIFHLTDGERSSHDIAEFVSVSQRTVSSRQQEWTKDGLLEKSGPSEPYQKLITLEEAGIDVPEIPELGDDDE